jgi:hypothetical protein
VRFLLLAGFGGGAAEDWVASLSARSVAVLASRMAFSFATISLTNAVRLS